MSCLHQHSITPRPSHISLNILSTLFPLDLNAALPQGICCSIIKRISFFNDGSCDDVSLYRNVNARLKHSIQHLIDSCYANEYISLPYGVVDLTELLLVYCQ